MLNTLLIDSGNNNTKLLENILSEYCPDVRIDNKIDDLKKAQQFVVQYKVNLIILDVNSTDISIFNLLNLLAQQEIVFIVLTDSKELAYEAIKFCATSYVLKPINPYDFSLAIKNAQKRIRIKEEYLENKVLINQLKIKLSEDDLIGIPTMDGFDFIKISEIIRCKGMQRCTQIVTLKKSNLISSYNLGEFKKLLEPLGFFSSHKSHLINVKCVKKYNRDGSILMTDGFNVPVARRRRSEFLSTIKHL